MEQKSEFESFELEVSDEIKGFLKETAKWAYLLSILGFVGIGFMVLGGVSISFFSRFNEFPSISAYGMGNLVGIGLVYLVLALVYFFPVMYLFKFSVKMRKALKSSNNQDFKTAFSNLKSHYKFIGIFSIVIISLYVLILIGFAGGAAFF